MESTAGGITHHEARDEKTEVARVVRAMMVDDSQRRRDGALLTSREVGALLRVSEATLSRWRHFKTGPAFVDMPGVIRYRWEDVERFIREALNGDQSVA